MTRHSSACIALVLLLAASAFAEPIEVQGASLGDAGLLAAGPIEVSGTAAASTHTVLVLEQPVLEGTSFAVRGEVRTVDVQGAGYLEMWTHFPDGNRYFSRTLADDGPLAKLAGSSERPFLLPFQSRPDAPAPTRLVINVVLPGAGQVELTDLHYVASLDASGASVPGAWWSERAGGWIGAGLGSVFGLAGGAIGLLVSLGRARGLAMTLLGALLAIGGAGLAAGLVALCVGQPYAVFYPLLLCGAIALPLALVGRRVAQQRYQADELRRMRAMDLG
jgi:hypothetical protein